MSRSFLLNKPPQQREVNRFIHLPLLNGSCIILALVLAGCATVNEKNVLKNTDALKTGLVGDLAHIPRDTKAGVLFSIDPRVKMTKYSGIMIDPPEIYFIEGARPQDMNPEDFKKIKDAFMSAIRKSLSSTYKIVERDGKGVLRVKTAITRLKLGSQTTIPSGAQNFLGNSLFIKEAAVEVQINDAVTDQKTSAYVDTKAGERLKLAGILSRWDDVDHSCRSWARAVREAVDKTFQYNAPQK